MAEAVNEKKLRYMEYLHRETADRHHTNTEDMYQYDLLRMGDPRAVEEGVRMFSSDLPGHISDDPLRNYKYLFVASITLASRSAIAGGMDALTAALKSDGSCDAAEAIMTTDTKVKEIAFSFTAGGKSCHIGGIAKGSGMIHPNMATMLVFVTTDCAITPEMLKSALDADVPDSFNMISIDGDTSTNDMVTVLANGEAGNDEITGAGEDYDAFCAALAETTRALCRMIAADGEGASKLLECRVSGAADVKTAKTVAKSVICSSLLKAAMFGADANWGRVLCAIGYSGADVDVSKIGVSFESPKGKIEVCRGGSGVDFSEEKAKEILLEKEIGILVDLGSGDAEATAWGCDLTYDYVKINGDYRT